MIFWGPPGVGKTTLARIIAHKTKAEFIDFSAVTSGIKAVSYTHLFGKAERADFGMNFSESLKKNQDFQAVYRNGVSYANRLLVMYVLENRTEKNRLGISVSKKVGNSVVRHRVTRLVRESYRLQENIFNSGLDIVVVARANAASASYREIESALLHLGRLHKIIG